MPDPLRVRMTSRAVGDLTAICTFIEKRSPQNAALVAQRVIDAIDSLALFPLRHRVHQHRKDPAKTVHAMPVSSFIVYYRVLATHRIVQVLTVRHGHRRQPKRF